jgi:hypothetical protein
MALGVSPAGIKNSRGIDSKGEAGETPALLETAKVFMRHWVRS